MPAGRLLDCRTQGGGGIGIHCDPQAAQDMPDPGRSAVAAGGCASSSERSQTQ